MARRTLQEGQCRLKNVKVFTEEKQFQQGEIAIADGVFAKEADGEVIDGEGCYAIPGMVDVHFHGCVGYDFCDGTEERLPRLLNTRQLRE